MTRAIRSYHWFFALLLSALAHGWLIYTLPPIHQTEQERSDDPLPFTVLLADAETAKDMVLETPEAESLATEEAPLISLVEENDSPIEEPAVTIDLSVEGDSLELIGEGEGAALAAKESEEIAMEAGGEENMAPEAASVVSMLEQADVAVETLPTAPLTAVAVLSPEQVTTLHQPAPAPHVVMEILPDTSPLEEMVDELAAPELEQLDGAESEMAMPDTVELDPSHLQKDTFSEEAMAPKAMPETSKVVLTEITIEQIEFDETVYQQLPEVKAEEWKPALPTATEAQKPGAWKQRYAGATGIGANYRKQMRSTLTQFVLYPRAVAEELKIEGKVVVGFTINRDGRLEETEILESSGHPVLDQAVEKMVEFAQPFTALPATVKHERIRFAFPVTVKLKR